MLLFVLGAGLATSILGAEEPKLVYGLVPNSPPTTYLDAAGKPTGFFIELYSRIMDELGIAYEFRVAAFPDIYPKLISGEVDFFTTLQKTPEREKLFVFADKGVAAGWGQLFVSHDTEIQSVLDLQHRKIGMVRGDRTGINFREYMESLAIPFVAVEFPDFAALLNAVRTGAVFGGIQSNWFVAAERSVAPTSVVFAPFRSYPVLSRNSVHLGDFERIIARYQELVASPNSWYYDLQAKWLGHERTETTVVPVWLVAGLAALFVASLVCFLIIKVLTGKLRSLNHGLERQIAERTALLVRSEKLASLGSLVAGIAHELNSPLQALVMSIDTVADSSDRLSGPGRTELTSSERTSVNRLIELRGNFKGLDQADSRAARGSIDKAFAALGQDEDPALVELCLELGIREPDREAIELLRSASANTIAAAADSTRLLDTFEIMRDAAARMSSVIRALRIYSRQDHRGAASYVSLKVQLESALALLSNRTKAGIAVSLDCEGLPPYLCYAEQLQQVWLNLAGNAIDAMGDRGRLSIRGSCGPDEIRISIEDDGPGVPAELQPRLFEPFFTTKPLGTGTGLGLSISREIVASHRGGISFESAPGRTVFTVSLPRAGLAADASCGGSAVDPQAREKAPAAGGADA
jgi:signal transduction histidine kinase